MIKRRPPRLLLFGVVGVVVVAAIAYFAFAKRIPFVHGYRFKAEFQSSNQLVTGFSPVRIAGVTVGKVVGVERGDGSKAIVTMEVNDTALPLHRDATVRIRPRLFLEGGFSVELTTGSPGAPNLPDGGMLPTRQTALPVQFDQILSTFDAPSREGVRKLIGGLDTAFGAGGAKALGAAMKPLAPALRDVAVVSQAARGPRTHDLSGGIASTSRITAALASRDSELRDLVTNLNRTTTALASRDVQLAGTIRAMDRLVTFAPDDLDRLDRGLPAIRRFVRTLRPSLRLLPGSLSRAVPVLDQLDALVAPGELPALVRAARPTVVRLPDLQTRLIGLFDLVTPVSACVRDKAVPALNAIVPDGKLTTGRPVWQELASALVGLAGASQDFDGNGYAIRFLGGLGSSSVSLGAPGSVDGVLRGLSPEPLTGVNPRFLGPGARPPYRPDVPCADSPVVDLSQRTMTGTSAARSRTLDEGADDRDKPTERRLRRAIAQAEEAVAP